MTGQGETKRARADERLVGVCANRLIENLVQSPQASRSAINDLLITAALMLLEGGNVLLFRESYIIVNVREYLYRCGFLPGVGYPR